MKTHCITILLTLTTLFCLGQEKLTIDTSESTVHWSGEYAFYFGGHKGNIDFKNGYLIKTGDLITGGEFVIDMNTIICTDNGKIDKNSGLVNHLKDPDFFDVKKYPTATLVITKVKYENDPYVKMYANLTIKDKTLPINFRAEMDYKNKQMYTRFKIDRTLWGITYNSKEIEGKLKDGLISDAIGFEVTLRLSSTTNPELK